GSVAAAPLVRPLGGIHVGAGASEEVEDATQGQAPLPRQDDGKVLLPQFVLAPQQRDVFRVHRPQGRTGALAAQVLAPGIPPPAEPVGVAQAQRLILGGSQNRLEEARIIHPPLLQRAVKFSSGTTPRDFTPRDAVGPAPPATPAGPASPLSASFHHLHGAI